MEHKKRKQHYVFQRYLSAWTINGKLWCKRDGKIFPAGTGDVAHERDFYRLRPSNMDERKFLEMLLRNDSPEIRQAMSIHTDAYLQPIKLQEQVAAIKRCLAAKFGEYSKIPMELQNCIKEQEQLTDTAVNNLDEDYYSKIEGEGTKWLEQLQKRDTSFYYENRNNVAESEYFDDEQYRFIYFVCVQYFRTKATHERWVINFGHHLDDPTFKSLNIPREKINLENILPHIIWEVENRTAFFLRNQNARLSLLINRTDIPFITSDQPVINLCANYQNLGKEVNGITFYYPISPDVAILLNSKDAQNIIYLTEDQVDFYNKAIIQASYHCIFADKRETIDRYTEEPLI